MLAYSFCFMFHDIPEEHKHTAMSLIGIYYIQYIVLLTTRQ